jgi:hypothetical protein
VGVIAICTGALSGAAACLATSLQELLNIAGSIAAVSLRLGIAMQKRAEALEKSIESWAFTASNLDEEELDREIESYNKVSIFNF